VNPQISYSQGFAEWEACLGAGLDLWQWETGVYPIQFKARVVAFWRLHNLVRNHTEDAATPKRSGKGRM
jgi:hypothetical protein